MRRTLISTPALTVGIIVALLTGGVVVSRLLLSKPATADRTAWSALPSRGGAMALASGLGRGAERVFRV